MNKKIFLLVALITISALLFSGCGHAYVTAVKLYKVSNDQKEIKQFGLKFVRVEGDGTVVLKDESGNEFKAPEKGQFPQGFEVKNSDFTNQTAELTLVFCDRRRTFLWFSP